MSKPLIIITPVKDSLETTQSTISHIKKADGDFSYYVFNDLSGKPTEDWLTNHQKEEEFTLINLAEHVNTPSPNYKTVLKMARKMALEKSAHLLIIESDVMVEKNTITGLLAIAEKEESAGMVGSVTVDTEGEINFPYLHVTKNDPELFQTERSLSFCCTLLTHDFLSAYNFKELESEKDWYDVFISKTSRRMGFKNYLSKSLPVIHKPHSSRPWKMEKYSNPIKYYFKKFFLGRDKI